MDIARIYFKKWVEYVTFKRYDRWCENNQEELDEIKFSIENKMAPIYWC